jgi:hypothetical protein
VQVIRFIIRLVVLIMIMRYCGSDDMLFLLFTSTGAIDWVLLSVQDSGH